MIEIESEYPISETRQKQPFCCPVCNGQGLVSRPPWLAGDVNQWTDTNTAGYLCRNCSGTGVIWG
jgi:hypothetical protein